MFLPSAVSSQQSTVNSQQIGSNYAELMTPRETVYPVTDVEITQKLRLFEYSSRTE
ncbi:MAG: hypothetical protein KME64_32700 [Scytonematopsis contorta HA4267-MV1]|nr:hypothetical protein [Scytonematopsis contorta HA4267-MV1]